MTSFVLLSIERSHISLGNLKKKYISIFELSKFVVSEGSHKTNRQLEYTTPRLCVAHVNILISIK